MNKSGEQTSAEKAVAGAAPLFGGITKEMWTVVLDDNGAWLPTDIFSETAADAQAVLDIINRHPKDDQPSRTDGARVTRCIVSIYPPNDKVSGGPTNS